MEASASNADPMRFAAALISSTPVLEALGQEYGKHGAQLILDSVKSLFAESKGAPPSEQPQPQPLSNAVPIQAQPR